MIKHRPVPLLLVLLAPFTPLALGATIPARDSRIVEVTVYPDRAEVVREAKHELPAGASTLEFLGLPLGVEPDSLTVTARGTAAALGAVEIRDRAEEPKETPEFLAAKGEVRRLEAEMARLQSEAGVAAKLGEFLEGLKATTAQRESERLGEGKADPASIQAVYTLVKTGLTDLAAEKRAREEKRREIEEALQVARARLAASQPPGSIVTRVAAIEVVAERAGPLTLRLAYVAPNATWRPAYRAALDAASGEIALASEAVVRQRTGEDWKDVTLRLSTAAPARGVNPPALAPWLLRPLEMIAIAARAKGQNIAYASGGVDAMSAPEAPMAKMDAAYEADENKDQESIRIDAEVVHSAYNVAFEVPGRSDVAADGSDHRVGLRQETLKGTVAYRTVPMLNPAAYLVAKTQAPPGYPLLAGPVRAFAGAAYLGSFPLAETGPGEDLTLPFGIDNRIKVERVPLPQSRSREGFVGKDRQIAYAFKTTVENLRDKPVEVLVEDRVPVSEDERIQVERGKGTTPGFVEVEARPGIMEWKLSLAPKEKRELILEYTVRHPKDLNVPGL